MVRNKAVYVALGVRPDGTKEILGLWIEQTEGAKFWLRVMNELKNRGVEDVLIAVVDGLKGFRARVRPLSTCNGPQSALQTSRRGGMAWPARRRSAKRGRPDGGGQAGGFR